MLDDMDKSILEELEFNSRQSNAKIAKKLGTNKAFVKYRIDRLQKNGIITDFSYTANQVILGKLSFCVLMQFKDISYPEEEKLISEIRKVKNVQWIHSVTGEWDVIISIIEKNIFSFMEALNKIFVLGKMHVRKYHFYVEHEGWIKTHEYLYSNPKKSIVRYGLGEEVLLNELEQSVYDILKKEPQISLLDIAKKLDKSYDTIKSKHNYLLSKKILLRCVSKIDIIKLGYKDFLCLFNLSPDAESIDSFIIQCRDHPNIIRYAKTLGHFNMILTIQAKNLIEFKKIMGIFKKKFSGIIISSEVIPLTS